MSLSLKYKLVIVFWIFFVFIIGTIFLFLFHSNDNNTFQNQHQQYYQQKKFDQNNHHNILPQSNDNITLVIQTDDEEFRIHRIQENIRRWEGPIVIGVSVSPNQGWQNSFVKTIQSFIRNQNRKNVDITIYETEQPKLYFPTNILRNVALSRVYTEFIFYIDVDFIVSKGIYQDLKRNRKQMDRIRTQKIAVIIPAFQFDVPEAFNNVTNKKDLATAIKKFGAKKVAPFHGKWGLQDLVQYDKWWRAEAPYNATVNHKQKYEPYFVTHRSMPRYDERFLGRGCNKIEQVWEMMKTGWRFEVDHRHFICHLPHPKLPLKKMRPVIRYNCDKLFPRKQKELNQLR
eukprot:gb/GECH01007900.1/.p1 GENE.gb/GECH01007900.1/~~gb/GECH01007900.1/.p1  ORF type:complete len:343 (+),score=63.29 gb/GECH01007900.1/:1-1029(+)